MDAPRLYSGVLVLIYAGLMKGFASFAVKGQNADFFAIMVFNDCSACTEHYTFTSFSKRDSYMNFKDEPYCES